VEYAHWSIPTATTVVSAHSPMRKKKMGEMARDRRLFVQHVAPRVHPEAADHVLDVHHLEGDGSQVQEGPGVGSDCELPVH